MRPCSWKEALHLSLFQSAWVQFAHYLGYFLMALPAGKLARNPCRFASLRRHENPFCAMMVHSNKACAAF